MDKLLEAYSGDKARGYDARRAKSGRWQREVAAMDSLLAEIGPETVVDCPFGTGRWIPQYERLGADVVGIDLSAGMLAEAATKLDALDETRRSRYRLVEASIFDVTPDMVALRPDLVVCVRFLNWVSLEDAGRAVKALQSLGARHAIMGVSVVPQEAGPARRMIYDLALKWANRKGGPAQHVHDEANVLTLFSGANWRVRRKVEVMSRPSRKNFFYLLDAAAT